MTAQQRRLARLRKILVFHQSNLAGFRKADCLCRRAEIPGVNSFSRTWSSSTDKSRSQMSMRSAIKIVMVMNKRLNNTLDSYNFKNGTIIIVDISGFTKL